MDSPSLPGIQQTMSLQLYKNSLILGRGHSKRSLPCANVRCPWPGLPLHIPLHCDRRETEHPQSHSEVYTTVGRIVGRQINSMPAEQLFPSSLCVFPEPVPTVCLECPPSPCQRMPVSPPKPTFNFTDTTDISP